MFWEIFVLLCHQKNITPSAACLELGFSKTMATNWKKGSVPRDSTLLKIAEYFGVSVAYLKGESENATPAREVVPLDQSNMRMIPLFESVAAGFCAYASEDIQDYMPVYFHNPSEADQTLCIKVRGDSMYPKIEDGDIIQVHKQDAVDNGSIAVVMVDDTDGLVKVVRSDAAGVELQSLNPEYPPRRFPGKDASRVRVVGLVTQVIKGVNGRKVHSIRMADSKKELMDTIDKMDADQLREFNRVYNEFMRSKEK